MGNEITPEVIEVVDEDFIAKFKSMLPAGSRKIDNSLIEKIQALSSDPDLADDYKSKMISYTRVLKDGRYKIDSYIDAIKFTSFKVSGLGITDSYKLTFPDKVAKWAAEGRDSKRISSNISMYNNNELVNLIFEQTMIPTHILNAGMFQEALNVAQDIMHTSGSDMARVQALNAILQNTKAPTTAKIELDIGVKEANVIDNYEEAMNMMVEKQIEIIKAGGNVKDIANAKIIGAK